MILFKEVQQFLNNYFTSCNDFFLDFISKLKSFFSKESKKHVITLFVIIIAAIVIRILFLNLPLRYDEVYTFINFVKEPISTTLFDYRSTNNHILHSLLVRLSYKLFGSSFWAIRLPAFLFGILIIPLTYLASRVFYNKNTALLTSAFVASSSILVEYSTMARGYTIICSVFLILLILAKYLLGKENIFAWSLFSIISTIGFFTMTIMMYPYLIIILWILLSMIFKDTTVNIKTNLKYLIISIFLTSILTFSLYSGAIIKFGVKSAITSNISNNNLTQNFFNNYISLLRSIWSDWNRDLSIWISVLLVIFFIIALIVHKKVAKYKVVLVIPSIICFLIISALLKNALNFGRHWLFLLPVYFMIACAGINFLVNKLPTKKLKFQYDVFTQLIALIITVFLCFSLFSSGSIYKTNKEATFTEAEAMTLYIKKNADLYDKVLITDFFPQPFIAYYFYEYSIPLGQLYYDSNRLLKYLKGTDEIFILMNSNKKIDDVIDIEVLKKSGYSNPQFIQNYGSFTLLKSEFIN